MNRVWATKHNRCFFCFFLTLCDTGSENTQEKKMVGSSAIASNSTARDVIWQLRVNRRGKYIFATADRNYVWKEEKVVNRMVGSIEEFRREGGGGGVNEASPRFQSSAAHRTPCWDTIQRRLLENPCNMPACSRKPRTRPTPHIFTSLLWFTFLAPAKERWNVFKSSSLCTSGSRASFTASLYLCRSDYILV